MEEYTQNWNNFDLSIGGKKITGVKEITFTPKLSIEELKIKLLNAESNEQYELCAELKKAIENFKH